MFLCRSLPPLADLPVPANRHRTQPCKTCTKPANPFGLTRPKSAIYPRNGPRQSQLSYLQCFQGLSLENGAFLDRKLIACVLVASPRRLEPESRHAVPPDRHRTPQRNNCTKPVSPLGLNREGKKRKKHPHPQSQNVDWNQQLKSEKGG
jgi:hypothetical protein